MTETCVSSREDSQRNSAELQVILPVSLLLLPRSLRWTMSPKLTPEKAEGGVWGLRGDPGGAPGLQRSRGR